jgi:hypothetical protein
MADQQGAQQTPSDFDARSDSAALALRQSLQRQGRPVSDSSPVLVDENGRPPAPLPPEGSYARQNIELQRRAQASRDAQQGQQPAQQQPAPQQTPPAQAVPEVSPRAEQRIQELVGQLRDRERQLQEAMEMGRRATETATQYEQRLQSLEQQHQQMLQANLDNLDPDTRAQVLMDARLNQQMDAFEQRIMSKVRPQLQSLEAHAAQAEMVALSQKYPGFDYQTHAPLIEQFRASNPRCSIEQAFRAVAEPEELGVRSAGRAQVVPPTIPPGSGELAAARYAQQRPAQQKQPEDELVEESRRIKELRASTDPAKQKEGLKLLDEHLKRRLG